MADKVFIDLVSFDDYLREFGWQREPPEMYYTASGPRCFESGPVHTKATFSFAGGQALSDVMFGDDRYNGIAHQQPEFVYDFINELWGKNLFGVKFRVSIAIELTPEQAQRLNQKQLAAPVKEIQEG